MALGSPSISDLRGDPRGGLNLREIQTAIANIRQRFEAVERVVDAAAKASTAPAPNTAANNALKILKAEITRLEERVTVLELTGTVEQMIFAAGEAITVVGQGVVPTADGTVVPADATDPLRSFGLLGLAVNVAGIGADVTVQRRGPFDVPTATFDVGRAVYIDGASGLTQTPDVFGTALLVGVAISATQVFIAPNKPALQVLLPYSSLVDVHTGQLSVTYSLVSPFLSVLNDLFVQPEGVVVWNGAALGTDLEVLPLLPSGGLTGAEVVAVKRDGVTVQTTASEFKGIPRPASNHGADVQIEAGIEGAVDIHGGFSPLGSPGNGGAVMLTAGGGPNDELGASMTLEGGGTFGTLVGGTLTIGAGWGNGGGGGTLDLYSGDDMAGGTGGPLRITVGHGAGGNGAIELGATGGGNLAVAPAGQVVTGLAINGPGGSALAVTKWLPVTLDNVPGFIPFVS